MSATSPPWPPQPGPPAAPPPPPRPPGSRLWLRITGGVVILGLVVALVVVLGGGGEGGDKRARASEVFLEPTASVGPAPPFTPSVANPANPPVTTTSTSASTTGAGTIRSTSGTTPGLYGGTRDLTSCDKEQLIRFLTQNPEKGRAWAQVEGINPSDIRSYIDALTPVVLRSDTRVTNHGFESGVATAHQSVLQAGTAVLVDSTGVPRARCYCGNPLLPPRPVTPTYTGPAWTGFRPATVVVVAPAPAVTVIVVVDVTTGQLFGRPVGSDGRSDTDAPPSTPASSTTTPSTTTAPPSGPRDRAIAIAKAAVERCLVQFGLPAGTSEQATYDATPTADPNVFTVVIAYQGQPATFTVDLTTGAVTDTSTNQRLDQLDCHFDLRL